MEAYFLRRGMYFKNFIIFLFYWIVITLGADPNEPPRYCKWDTLRAKCPAGSVIIMEEVLYGRMQYGKCIERDFGYVGCSNDVLPIADAKCSGRRDCQIPVPDMDMDAISECPNDLNRYLQATYDCVPVLPATKTQCQIDGVAKAQGSSGNIASITTNETGCGGTDHPWLVEGESGQRINFTLMDFALFVRNTSKSSPFSSHCHVYVIFKEELGGNDGSSGRSVTICGGKQRIEQVYTSTTHKVEVRVLGRNRNFIVNYTVWGCPRISKPSGGWVEQRGDRADIGCSDSSDIWRLTCNGTHWLGQKPNCSSPGSSSQLVIGKISLPYVASVIIIVIVAVVIGLSILLVGLICLRRQKLGTNQRNRQPTEADIQEESHYKAALKLSNPPPYYRSSSAAETPLENEYAYVEDFLLPPPAVDGVPMNKIISSQQVQYPNSTANHYGALGLSSKQSSMHPMLQGQNSGCERVPRHYFELEHHVFADGHNSRSLPPLHSVPHSPSQMLKYPPS